MADAAIEPYFVVDRLAGVLELLLMLVLGRVEQLADNPIVQVDDFIRDRGDAIERERSQSGVTARSAGVI